MTEEPKMKPCVQQALAQLESIKEMVEAYNLAGESGDTGAMEDAGRAILEDALSVEMRGDWYLSGESEGSPVEYRILLCTGGPAVQILGTLNEYSVPITALLQAQDWFVPWENVDLPDYEKDTEALLTYARCFCYGE